jgi:hypothetical protein
MKRQLKRPLSETGRGGSRARRRTSTGRTDTITAGSLRSLQSFQSSSHRCSKGLCHQPADRGRLQPTKILSRKKLPSRHSILSYRLVSFPSSAKRPSAYFALATRRSRMGNERINFAGFRICGTMSRIFTYIRYPQSSGSSVTTPSARLRGYRSTV